MKRLPRWELRVERKDVFGKELPEKEFSLSYEVGERGVLGVVPGRKYLTHFNI